MKGLVVIVIFIIGTLVAVRYYTSHQQDFNSGSLNLSPAALEEKVLGVFNKIVGSQDEQQLREEFAAPVKEIERKANELIEEIKNLPQDQAEVVKNQLLRTVCEPTPSAESTEASQPAQLEGE
ncbi:hypothetical protein MUP65_00165 [Patescibacteria group bacterium]|nr:hypothetical protein [Patescibacteria group bacterium]